MAEMQGNELVQAFALGFTLGVSSQGWDPGRVRSYVSSPKGTLHGSSNAVCFNYVTSPREALHNTLNELIAAGLLLDADFEELQARRWEVFAIMPEEYYFDRGKRRLVIRRITDAIDRKFKIYTDIHLRPTRKHAHSR